MYLYFFNMADNDGTNLNNWFEDDSGTIPHNDVPSAGDDCFIQSGTCDDNIFSSSTLTVNPSGALGNNAYTVLYNYGTITTNSGTVSTNTGTITTNSGTVESNAGLVESNDASGTVSINSGTVTANTGTVTTNTGTGVVSANGGSITTNDVGGRVDQNNYAGAVVTNNGTVKIGAIHGGSGILEAIEATDLSNHTGINVTLPSGGGSLTWW